MEAVGNTVIATVTVGDFPIIVANTPDGQHVYVANSDSDNVSVIEAVGNTVIATVTVGNFPLGVASTPDGQRVYVANAGSDNV
ncbi:40-residue YVTN family beta-propeller, partial [Bacillus cereus]